MYDMSLAAIDGLVSKRKRISEPFDVYTFSLRLTTGFAPATTRETNADARKNFDMNERKTKTFLFQPSREKVFPFQSEIVSGKEIFVKIPNLRKTKRIGIRSRKRKEAGS